MLLESASLSDGREGARSLSLHLCWRVEGARSLSLHLCWRVGGPHFPESASLLESRGGHVP